jgi:hypothetical protein
MRTKIAAVLGVVLLTVLGTTVAASAAPKPPKGGGDVTAPQLPPGVTTPDQCSDKQIYFFFEYNDSNVIGYDSGCANQNDITAQTNPGLKVPGLHVSCSDPFTNGIPSKSSLGDPNRRITAYYIDKGSKTCGFGTPTVVSAGGVAGGIAVAVGIAGTAVVVERRRRRNLAAV